MSRDGGQIVVDALLAEGVDTVFTVPGESFLPVLNALIEPKSPVTVVSTRHEEGAGFAAEAFAKASGRPGVAMVTRGPGVTNVSIALHTAMQDSTPLVVFVGQVPTDQRYREAFQEVDLVSYLSPIVKWAIEVPQTERLPELIRQAFRVARTGRPGPVVVGLPEDILFASADVADAVPVELMPPGHTDDAIMSVIEILAAAERPLIIAGREVAGGAGHEAVKRLAHAWQMPVMAAFRRFDAYPADDSHFVGPIAFGAPAAALAPLIEADVALVLGDRLDEVTTGGYEYLKDARIVQVGSDPSMLGTWGRTALAITAGATAFANSLADQAPPMANDGWSARVADARGNYERLATPEQPYQEGGVNISAALARIRSAVPEETSFTTDAGNFAGWVARFYGFTRPHTHFGPLSGAMGYAAPAAVGVALAQPDNRVIAFAGDGGFAMTMNELATMKAHGLRVTVVVFVNGIHGTIRTHQERHYPGRPIATDLTNPGFRQLAESFGVPAWTVTDNGEFDAALDAALAVDGPGLIEVIEGRERLSVWGKPG